MQIEFIGCTSAGKSTLINGILRALHQQGMDATTGDDFVLKLVKLNWIKGYLGRRFTVDLLSLLACLVSLRDNFRFYFLSIRVLSRLPSEVGWFRKMNIVRNVMRCVGIHEIIRRGNSGNGIVLLDEGTLQTVNYMFVHISVEPNFNDLSTYAKLVPQPDVVVYVQQEESVLIERTLVRTHKRISDGSYAQAQCFIKRTVATLDHLVYSPDLRNRVLIVDGERNITVIQDDSSDSYLSTAHRIVRVGLDAVGVENSVPAYV